MQKIVLIFYSVYNLFLFLLFLKIQKLIFTEHTTSVIEYLNIIILEIHHYC